MAVFEIGTAAADNNEEDDRPASDKEDGSKVGAIVPTKNINESIGHNLLTHRTSSAGSSESGVRQLDIVNSAHLSLKRMLPMKPKLIPKFSIGQISINSVHSTFATSDTDTSEAHQGRWIDDKAACDHFTSLLSSVYGLLLTIFSLALEISESFNAQEHVAEIVFYAYMYGGALIFFAFCYLFVLYPGWFNLLQKVLKKYGVITGDQIWQFIKASHTGEGAGSLYLRLGAVCFGTVGIVYYGLEIFLCINNNSCHSSEYEKYALGGIFTFLQMHFIFCNSKVRINGSKNLAKFGTMHLVAVNLWTWFKYVLAKQAAKNSKLAKESFKKGRDDSSSSSEEIDDEYDAVINATVAAIKKAYNATISTSTEPCRSANDFFGDTATLMTTCVVEFSLIGAGVMFIMWRTIGTVEATLPGGRHGRKHRMRVDCSASSTGLFAGLLFLVAAFVSIGVFSALSQLAESKLLQLVFGLSDLALFLISLFGCVLGLWRMRQLSYSSHQGHGNAEVLDEILLIIGLIGEVTFCSAGLISWAGTQYDFKQRQAVYIVFIYVARLSQVLLQTVFILLSGRLRVLGRTTTQQMKPGKQFVTFLLVANVTLFLFHTFQGQRSGVGYSDGSAFFGAQSWSFLIQAVSPLIVFYRFHSSVCLAEIWKHSYNLKDSHSGSRSGGPSNGGLSRSASVHSMIHRSI